MIIDWVSLFEDEGIPFVTAGKNTSKNHISIKCPFCMDDPSEHLGISLKTGFWSCWRDVTHRGRSPERLLTNILGIQRAVAASLIERYHLSTDELPDCRPLKQARLSDIRPVLPAEFRPIEAESITHKFWQYLYDRDFDDPDALINDYNLGACLTGRWKGRIIIPSYDKKGLIGWQGRAIRGFGDTPRYLTSSDLLKANLFNLKEITEGGEDLYICEGPFDALKVDFYAKTRGVRATCTYGVNLATEQLSQLIELKSRFKRYIVLFDNDPAGIAGGFALSNYMPVEFGVLPEFVSDSGSMTKQQVLTMI